MKCTDADGREGGLRLLETEVSSWVGEVYDPSVCRLDGPEGEGGDLRTSRD